MGYSQVFVQVGDQVRIQAPSGHWVAPLVTGTFGSSDFIHSLLGGMCVYFTKGEVPFDALFRGRRQTCM